MNVSKIVQELLKRRDALDEAIRAFETLGGVRVSGRKLGRRKVGRPPSRVGRPVGRPSARQESPAPEFAPARKRRRKAFSAATIERMRAAQQARWRKIRAGKMVNPFQK
jgi:hypothetical protein